MNFINLLFSPSGRINRAKWWLAVVFLSVVWTVAVGVLAVFLAQDIIRLGSEPSTEDTLRLIANYGLVTILFLILIVIPIFVSSIFVGIKRLHDRNKSGWWIVLFYFGPTIVGMIGRSIDGSLSLVFWLISFAIAVWAFIELGCLRGTAGPNRYGPDPLGPGA